MRKLLFFPTLLLFVSCQGQLFSIASDKNNVLYAGVENPLTITVQTISPKLIIVNTDNGRLKGSDGHYVFYTDTGSMANITIFRKTTNGLIKIGVGSFRVKQLPDPPAYFGRYFGGDISLGELKAVSGLSTDLKAIFYEIGIPIISFDLNIIRQSEFLYKEVKNEGEAFKQDVINAISHAKIGDSIIFNNIFARRHDGTLTILSPLTLRIKN